MLAGRETPPTNVELRNTPPGGQDIAAITLLRRRGTASQMKRRKILTETKNVWRARPRGLLYDIGLLTYLPLS